MKRKVIVMLDNEKISEEIMKNTLNKWFPIQYFDIDIYNYERVKRNFHINDIWMKERLPIIIGVGIGAVYLERVKNYDRKYLISPIWNETLKYNMFSDIDDYDKDNTFCFLGNNPKNKELYEIYTEHYPNTFNGITEGNLNIIEGLEFCGMFNFLLSKGK